MHRKTIYLEIAGMLRTAIRNGEYAGMRFPSETQLMRKYSIGRQTAIRALNQLVQERLIVRRKGAGTFLSKIGARATGRIGLIIHGSDYCEMFSKVSKQISLACQKSAYSLVFVDASFDCASNRIERVLGQVDKFIVDGVDGVIFQPIELVPNAEKINEDIVRRLSKAGIPLVLLDSDIVTPPSRSEYDLVSVDHLSVGRRLAKHLRQTGARRIVYLMQRHRAPCVQERHTGVRLGCEGLELAGEAVYAAPENVASISRMLKRDHPDAIVCYNDRQAALLLQTLAKLGKRVPEDIQVAGFDDVQCARLTIPQLTTMRQPCEAIGNTIVKMLIERIKDPSLSVRAILLNATLVVRASTKSIER